MVYILNECPTIIRCKFVLIFLSTVSPDPGHIVVDGCSYNHYCILRARYEGNISCSVYNIRPEVKLEWRTAHETTASKISFDSRVITKTHHGDTLDITETSTFVLHDRTVERLPIECTLVGPNAHLFELTTNVDLLFDAGKIVFMILTFHFFSSIFKIKKVKEKSTV